MKKNYSLNIKQPVTIITDKYNNLCFQLSFTNLFSQAPQDINQQLEMRNYLIKNRGPSTVVKILGLIACCLEWAKQERLIPEDFTINYREYAQRYKKGSEMKNLRRKKPKLVEGKSQNHSKIAWTKEERDLIIKTYYARDRRQFKYQFDYLSRAIELLFLTGLRISEMTALRWKQISKDFSFIRVDDTYLPRIKEFKGNTKNYKTREVPCSPRVKDILKELIDFKKTEESFVFLNVVGNPLSVNNIFTSWGGQMRTGKQGIVVKLFLEGKLPVYIEPYSTRRTFVSVQVRKFDATTVAAWVGDNPMTIFTHYCYKDETAVPTE